MRWKRKEFQEQTWNQTIERKMRKVRELANKYPIVIHKNSNNDVWDDFLNKH
jgi:hypothetical protein